MPPAVPFDQLPTNVLVPFVYVEVASAGSAEQRQDYRSLLIGQRLAAGAVAEAVPTLIGTGADADRAFGRGSQLALMARAFRGNNPTGELWCLALDDAAGAVAETHTITATAAATAAGTISLYIAGRRVSVAIANGATVNQIAAAIHAAVTSRDDLPVTSAVAAAVVTLTARNAGASQDIDVQLNFQPDEALPAGVALDVAAGVAGATDPDIADAIAAFGDEQYNLIVSPYTGSATVPSAAVTALNAELESRFSPTIALEGNAILGLRSTLAQATTYGNALNSYHLTVVGHGASPFPAWEDASAVAGSAAESFAADPALPLQTKTRQRHPAPEGRRPLGFHRAEHGAVGRHLDAPDVGDGAARDRASGHDLADERRLDGPHDAADAELPPAQLPLADRLEVCALQAGRRRHAGRGRAAGDHAFPRPRGGDRLVRRHGGARARRGRRRV